MSNTQSNTPRTDARLTEFDSISKYGKHFKNRRGVVSADFARELERELVGATAEIQRIRTYWELTNDQLYDEQQTIGLLRGENTNLEFANKRLSRALRAFVDFYPAGINPDLDRAWNAAREALAKNP